LIEINMVFPVFTGLWKPKRVRTRRVTCLK